MATCCSNSIGVASRSPCTRQAGVKAWLDLTGIAVCYYTFPAMQLNAARYEAPKGARKLMRFPQ